MEHEILDRGGDVTHDAVSECRRREEPIGTEAKGTFLARQALGIGLPIYSVAWLIQSIIQRRSS